MQRFGLNTLCNDGANVLLYNEPNLTIPKPKKITSNTFHGH